MMDCSPDYRRSVQGAGAKHAGHAYSQHWFRSLRRAEAKKKKDTLIFKLQQDKIELSARIAQLKLRLGERIVGGTAGNEEKLGNQSEMLHIAEKPVEKPVERHAIDRKMYASRFTVSSSSAEGSKQVLELCGKTDRKLSEVQEKIDMVASFIMALSETLHEKSACRPCRMESVPGELGVSGADARPHVLNPDAAEFVPEQSGLKGSWEALKSEAMFANCADNEKDDKLEGNDHVDSKREVCWNPLPSDSRGGSTGWVTFPQCIQPEFNIGAPESFPANPHESVPGDFRSMPLEAWAELHDQFQVDDFPETSEMDLGDSIASEEPVSDDEDRPCNRCGELVNMQDSNADMCDTCDSVLHTDCLTTFSNLRGEWSLCQACLYQFEHGGGVRSLRCDFRAMPATAWGKVHAMFSVSSGIGDNAAQAFQPLDSTLDFILRFLEGDHAKSDRLTAEGRSTILRCVQSSIEWKKSQRSNTEIEQYVKHLNGVMGDIVTRL